ncbi:ABC transporter permease [Planctomicrobium sp. SH661]|uniref:ABC transporter permease n=1 Tax=Planctomicrobium sp. SH661 TaxID=3448124 RepID=UPI003F5B2672
MLKFALGNLLSRSLRSILALTGLAIAIGGMVALFSIAQGIDYVVNRTFAQIPGLAIQQRGAPVPLFSTLPAAWGEEIARIPGVTVVDAEVVQRLNVMEGKALISPPRFIVGLDLRVRPLLDRDVYRENIVSGRAFQASDASTSHCLISQQIADETGRKVGDKLRLNDFTADIIGIYNTGSALLDVNVLMDLSTVRQMMRVDPGTVSFFYAESAPGVDQRELKAEIERRFLNRSVTAEAGNSLSGWGQAAGWLLRQMQSGSTPEAATSEAPSAVPTGISAVEVRLAEDWSERFSEFTGDLELFLMLITTMAVLIAVLSIVNTMTMSVSERMIEFGILRANGWSKFNIMQLMTLESGLLGIAGGVVGALLGWVTTVIVNSIYSDRLQLHATPALLLFAVVVSTVLGIAGGLYPAWLAASRSPMDAIRRG